MDFKRSNIGQRLHRFFSFFLYFSQQLDLQASRFFKSINTSIESFFLSFFFFLSFTFEAKVSKFKNSSKVVYFYLF